MPVQAPEATSDEVQEARDQLACLDYSNVPFYHIPPQRQ